MSIPCNIEARCDCCATSLGAPVYSPVLTRRSALVYVCPSCGLTQSHYGSREIERISTLSCDADWGNVRHGKGVRLAAAQRVLDGKIDWAACRNVLDVGANRGDFLLWLRNSWPHLKLDAVEPDSHVVGAYSKESRISLSLARLEQLTLVPEHYDFVYCSHTLEHANSATAMLRQIHGAMRTGGLLYLEVPNLEVLDLKDSVEEFFIDKHTFHFDRRGLVNLVCHLGFDVVAGADDNDSFNISLLLCRLPGGADATSSVSLANSLLAESNRRLVVNHSRIIQANRDCLPRIVREQLQPFSQRQKVAYWGAARIFDALVKYGGLQAKDVPCLVDAHLSSIVMETHGITILKPDYLKRFEPQVVVILARSATDAIATEVRRMGIRHILNFHDLLGQCQ